MILSKVGFILEALWFSKTFILSARECDLFMQSQGHSETAYTFPGYFPSGENRILPAFYEKFGSRAKPWSLPHPDEIRKQMRKYGSESSSSGLFISSNGVAVKWGPHVATSEAISMMTVDTYIGRECPVPKVYGWFVEPAQDKNSETQPPPNTFIYMEHVHGQSIAERLNTLKPQEFKYITRQLCKAIIALRSLNSAGKAFIGGIDQKPLPDSILTRHWKDVSTEVGPFTTVAAFHDWLASIARVKFNLPPDTPIQKRKELPGDDTPIVFTHAALAPHNIMITASGDGPARLAGIVDWSQAGFYPAYWEFWKARVWGDQSGMPNQWVENILPDVTAPFNAPEPGLDFFYSIARRTPARIP